MARIDVEKYWQEPPPESSPGLLKWLAKLRSGWQPNRRISSMGYYAAAEFFGVYIWEYLHVLRPAMYEGEGDDSTPSASLGSNSP